MSKGIRIADLRRLERDYADGKISYSKMVEALNEIAQAPLNKQLEEAKKKVTDTLNWAKSELKEEEHSKLSKIMNPYRTEKIRFLRKTINHLNQEG